MRDFKKTRRLNLRTKFALIALVAALQMTVLVVLSFLGIGFINRLTDYQYLQRSVQLGFSNITNYLNQTVSWAIEPDTLYTEWNEKLVSLNKKFHKLHDDKVTKYFGKDFADNLMTVKSRWSKILGMINPFNNQYKTMQEIALSDEVKSLVRRSGIQVAFERFPEDENVNLLYSQQFLIRNQMKDIMKEEASLKESLEVMNEMLGIQVERISRLLYAMEIFLGAVFVVLIFVLIRLGTGVVSKNILRVREFSSGLAEKDFRHSIVPSGSTEMQDLMGNMNGMVKAVNDFFIVVKKTAARAISSGYSINDSASSTAAATKEINGSIEAISSEFEHIDKSVTNAARAIEEINRQVETLVVDNAEQTSAIDESTSSISSMVNALISIKENALLRTKNAEEMKSLVFDGDQKIAFTASVLEDVMTQLDEIAEIITIIDGVSEKTNLLSMNAAIESAHAGDAGKGFAVVAEEIKVLAESTATNAQKINDSITNIINKVTEATKASHAATLAFGKVSSHSAVVIDSFREISGGLEELGSRASQITQKTDITADAADKINGYCVNIASQQDTISEEISSIEKLFKQVIQVFNGIKKGTGNIVERMETVGNLSKEGYRNMADLENVLEQFKTSSDDDEEVQLEVNENPIEKIISSELQQQIEHGCENCSDGMNSVEFDPDSVEEC